MSDAATTTARASEAIQPRIEEFPNLINGEQLRGVAKPFDNTNPADTSDIVGRFQASTAAEAKLAVDAAAAAFERWKKNANLERAQPFSIARPIISRHMRTRLRKR